MPEVGHKVKAKRPFDSHVPGQMHVPAIVLVRVNQPRRALANRGLEFVRRQSCAAGTFKMTPKVAALPGRWAALLAMAAVIVLGGGGCSSSLREVRAREPEFRVPGIPASSQFVVARCIRDVLEGTGEEVVLEIEREPDGMHVIGRRDEPPSAAVYDVAVREDAVVAMVAPPATAWTAVLRNAVVACIGGRS